MATSSWKTATTGNWDTATNWNTGTVPDNGDDATIGFTTAYTVTINSGETYTVGTLTLSDTRATLQDSGDLILNTAATINGTFNLSGTLDLSAGATATVSNTGTSTNAKLNLTGGTVIGGTLSGTGTIQTTGNSTSYFDGTVDGGLTIDTPTTVRVLDGNALTFGGPANSTAAIHNKGTITVGTVSTVGTSGNATLNVANQVTLDGGGKVVLSDTNAGTNQIRTSADNSGLDNVDNTISGAGSIQNYYAFTLTNETAGKIIADSDNYGLNLSGITVNNTGLVEDTGAVGLTLTNTQLNNTGGTLEANGTAKSEAAIVNLNNSTVKGGTLTTTGSGVIETSGTSTSTLDLRPAGGVTISTGSSFQVVDSTTLHLVGPTGGTQVGTLTNNGTLTLNATTNSGDYLTIDGHVKLAGGGNIVLSDAGTSGSAGTGKNTIQSASDGSTLENFDNTISGAGTIQPYYSFGLTNDSGGTIDANSAQFALNINSNNFTVTNKGLIEDTGAGGLNISSATINGTMGGTLEAAGAGSTVNLSGATIKGGTVTTTGGGVVQTVGGSGTSYLDLSTPTSTGIDGSVKITAGSTVGVVSNSELRLTGVTGLSAVGTLNNAGTVEVKGGASNSILDIYNNVKLTGGGNITLDSPNSQIRSLADGSTLDNVDNTVSGAGTIQPYYSFAVTNETGGTFEATSATNALNISTPFTNLGTLKADSGATLALTGTNQTFGGTATGAGTVSIGSGATFNNLSLAGSVTLDLTGNPLATSGGFSFASGSTATLELDSGVLPSTGGSFTNPIANFSFGDKIDLRGLAFAGNPLATYSGTTLSVTEGTVTDMLTKVTMPGGMVFTAADDGHGGTVLSAVCYASGTLIRTAQGDIAVEDLQVGDLVVTASSAQRPIKWLGHRTMDCRRHADPGAVMPVRVSAHAFGPNKPARDLYVSPGHAICVDVVGEVLIPAIALVNGATIAQVEVDEVTYWHVELDSHDVILAENLPAESYLDLGNRAFFAENDVVLLDASLEADPALREQADFCRPFHFNGPIIDVVRTQMRARALASGWRLSTALEAHIEVDGARIDPVVHDGAMRFLVPAGAKDVWLVSPVARPSETTGSSDARALGLDLRALQVDDGFTPMREIRPDDPRLDAGFSHVENGHRWTTGRARLPTALWADCADAFFLRLDIASPPVARWVGPEGEADVQADFRMCG